MKKLTTFAAQVASNAGDVCYITFSVSHPDYDTATYLVQLHSDGEGMSWNRSHKIHTADKMLELATAKTFAEKWLRKLDNSTSTTQPATVLWYYLKGLKKAKRTR